MKKKIIILAILSFSIFLFSEFDIEKFVDPQKYGWDSLEKYYSDRKNIEERQKLLQIYDFKKLSVSKNILKSVIAPGWGHFTAKRYTKGQILLGLEVILIGSGIYYYDKAMENYDKYKKADYIGDIEKYYTDANTPFQYSKILLGFGVVVWLYTIYDTIQVTEEYNNELWDNIYMEYYKKNLIITPTGFTLRF